MIAAELLTRLIEFNIYPCERGELDPNDSNHWYRTLTTTVLKTIDPITGDFVKCGGVSFSEDGELVRLDVTLPHIGRFKHHSYFMGTNTYDGPNKSPSKEFRAADIERLLLEMRTMKNATTTATLEFSEFGSKLHFITRRLGRVNCMGQVYLTTHNKITNRTTRTELPQLSKGISVSRGFITNSVQKININDWLNIENGSNVYGAKLHGHTTIHLTGFGVFVVDNLNNNMMFLRPGKHAPILRPVEVVSATADYWMLSLPSFYAFIIDMYKEHYVGN